ncbi:MAG: 4,5-DOPA dioxygenase extradiol [Flavobacteriaceae bacterium]|jgi:4,5-DOPA dioxygenase extradiol|nr:4,5-DOPA dioxygenase extradiol [Flavobacteriaceae bacterium]
MTKTIEQLLQLPNRNKKMPTLFIGHGSPMNAIENNEFSNYWKKLGQQVDIPAAILVVSAHWLTHGTFVTAMDAPRTIHDFGGFPQALFDVNYPAPGSKTLVQSTIEAIENTIVHEDLEWGLDHGTWSILCHMFPEAQVPVVQLSIDYHQNGGFHYQLGQQLQKLRSKGVLIIGSGNIVHNLRALDWKHMQTDNYGFDWAIESNETFKKDILEFNHNPLQQYENLGESVRLAVPTPDHYYPLLYTLGSTLKTDNITIFNDKYVGGSLSMTSFIFDS